jgi:hypothetical protein
MAPHIPCDAASMQHMCSRICDGHHASQQARPSAAVGTVNASARNLTIDCVPRTNGTGAAAPAPSPSASAAAASSSGGGGGTPGWVWVIVGVAAAATGAAAAVLLRRRRRRAWQQQQQNSSSLDGIKVQDSAELESRGKGSEDYPPLQSPFARAAALVTPPSNGQAGPANGPSLDRTGSLQSTNSAMLDQLMVARSGLPEGPWRSRWDAAQILLHMQDSRLPRSLAAGPGMSASALLPPQDGLHRRLAAWRADRPWRLCPRVQGWASLAGSSSLAPHCCALPCLQPLGKRRTSAFSQSIHPCTPPQVAGRARRLR